MTEFIVGLVLGVLLGTGILVPFLLAALRKAKAHLDSWTGDPAYQDYLVFLGLKEAEEKSQVHEHDWSLAEAQDTYKGNYHVMEDRVTLLIYGCLCGESKTEKLKGHQADAQLRLENWRRKNRKETK